MRVDVAVVGGGHAGCEAAAAAARMGRSVALITLERAGLGRLSCNPAIGGLAKGHLVREIDALGGLMARAADRATLQFRHLNTRKGLAVRSSRAQVDVARYPKELAALLEPIEGLSIVEAEVHQLRLQDGRVSGVRLADGSCIEAPRVILTTGTFLSAVMHCGEEQEEGGRRGERAAHALSDSLRSMGLRLGRLKTGTTPRLDGRSIDWERVLPQTDVRPDARFSFGAPAPRAGSVRCYLAYTNPRTHEIIEAAADRSPMYTGRIVGVGPRYCPSVEDKVRRFAERTRHQIFLEPEGLHTHRVYPSGLATSLPADVQEDLVHSIVGLERAVLLQHGYAVEYDYADPRDLGPDLQHQQLHGLYLAGQVNGTSGYEEAAAQGLIAGISAARGEPLRLGRDQAYLGVLVDDLVSRGVGGEPYRMFTSRAEHRLLLREDNADRRLMPLGRSLGLIDDPTWARFEAKLEQIERACAELDRPVHPTAETLAWLERQGDPGLGKPTTVRGLLRRPLSSYAALSEWLDLPRIGEAAAEQVEIDARYAGYIQRAKRRAVRTRRLEGMPLPRHVQWRSIGTLSNEVCERLEQARPPTLGAMARLPGITPAAVQTVAAWLAASGQGGRPS